MNLYVVHLKLVYYLLYVNYNKNNFLKINKWWFYTKPKNESECQTHAYFPSTQAVNSGQALSVSANWPAATSILMDAPKLLPALNLNKQWKSTNQKSQVTTRKNTSILQAFSFIKKRYWNSQIQNSKKFQFLSCKINT